MFYEDIVDALGGRFLEGSEGYYETWSPNMYKTIFIFNTGVLIEYHGETKPVWKAFKHKSGSSKRPLGVFNLKQFGCLEVLGFPTDIAAPFDRMFPQNTRLSLVMEHDLEMGEPHWLIDAVREERSRVGVEPYFSQLSVWKLFLEGGEYQLYNVKSIAESSTCAPLFPQVYKLDQKGGKLWELLRTPLKNTSPEMADMEMEDVDSDDTDLEDSVESYEPLPEDLMSLLRICADKSHPLYSELNATASRCISPSAKDEPWFKAFNPSLIGSRRDIPWMGYFLDSESSLDENAFNFIYRMDKDLRDKLGYKKPSVARSETYEGLLSKIEGYSEDSTSELDESEVLDFYRGRIRGAVLEILEEYEKIFASGFGVLKPVGVLTESEGKGQLLALSSDGRVIKKKYSGIHMTIWSLIQKTLSLTCYDTRNVAEIAKISVASEGNVYFPYKMLEYAFGRKSNTGEQDLYPPASSARGWKEYSKNEVEKSLTLLLERVVTTVCSSSDKEFINLTGEVGQAIDKIRRSLCTCVLLSSYNEVEGIPVKAKVRVLCGDISASALGENLLLDAYRTSLGTVGGSNSRSYPPVFDGIFAEYRHESNSKMANVEPLFAYKLLQSSMDAGIPLNPDNAILGITDKDTIAYSGSGGIKMNIHTSHFNLAGSRSGKGLLTQAVTAGYLAVGKPVGLADNKPDMASLLLHIAPNGFVINGQNINSAPEKGDDIFGVFDSGTVRSLENMANIPEYLYDLKGFSSSYTGMLGTIVYLRYMLLSLGILAVRSMGGEYPRLLGGEQGVVFIFDEISNTGAAFRDFFYGAMPVNHLVPQRYMDQWRVWQEAGGGTTKRPEATVNPEDFWYSAVYQSVRDSLTRLFMLKNAGFKNQEALVSDVFMIGQDKEFPITDSSEIDKLIPPPNRNIKGASHGANDPSSILSSLASIGRTDALLGYNVDHPDILNQDPVKGGVSRDKLNADCRNFGYIPDFSGATLKGAFSGDETVAQKAQYFKPALLFADGSEEGYCWRNACTFMQASGYSDIEGVIERNSDDNGHLHPAVGFEGYLNVAGITASDIQATQQKLSDAAQVVVEKLGYRGTWKEFLLDLRPEWIFSVEDVYRVFGEGSHTSKLTKDFREVFPECFGNISVRDSLENLDMDSDDEEVSDWNFEPKVAPEVSPELSTPSPYAWHPFEDCSLPTDSSDYMPDLDIPLSGTVFEGTDFRAFDLQEMTPEGFQQALLEDLERYVGSWGRVKALSVVGEHLILNKTVYRTKLGDTWKDNQIIPPYMKESVRTSNIAPVVPWTILENMSELRVLSFDSWEFFLTYVAPDLGINRSKFAPGELFRRLDKLQAVQIGDSSWDYKTYTKQIGVPTGVERFDQVNYATRVCSDYLKRSRGLTWEYTRNVWARDDLGGLGKMWRTGVGLAGLMTVGTTEVATRGLGGVFNRLGKALSSYRNELRSE